MGPLCRPSARKSQGGKERLIIAQKRGKCTDISGEICQMAANYLKIAAKL